MQKEPVYVKEIGARWHKRQVGTHIMFCLCIYVFINFSIIFKKNEKFIFFITWILFSKFYLNQTSITILQKREKSDSRRDK